MQQHIGGGIGGRSNWNCVFIPQFYWCRWWIITSFYLPTVTVSMYIHRSAYIEIYVCTIRKHSLIGCTDSILVFLCVAFVVFVCVPVSTHLSEGRKLLQYWDTPARHNRPQHRDGPQGDKHRLHLCWCSWGRLPSTHLSEGRTCTQTPHTHTHITNRFTQNTNHGIKSNPQFNIWPPLWELRWDDWYQSNVCAGKICLAVRNHTTSTCSIHAQTWCTNDNLE